MTRISEKVLLLLFKKASSLEELSNEIYLKKAVCIWKAKIYCPICGKTNLRGSISEEHMPQISKLLALKMNPENYTQPPKDFRCKYCRKRLLKYVRKKYKTKIEVVGDLCLPRDKENYLKFNLKRTVLNNLERKGMIQQKGNKYFINKKEFINQIIISMLGILNYSSERIKDALPMLSSSIILEKIIINFYRKYSEYNYIESHKDLAQLLITGLSSFSREKFFELEHKKSHNKRILSQDFELNLLQQTCWIYEGNKTRDSNKIINDIINNLISS